MHLYFRCQKQCYELQIHVSLCFITIHIYLNEWMEETLSIAPRVLVLKTRHSQPSG